MAGRGTDIKLGGENEQEWERVVSLGGLYVIGTNRHESRRVDNQLRGRSGRQGDPGSARFFVSLEDDLMKRYRLDELLPPGLYPKKQEGPVDNSILRREMARAQRIMEGQNFDMRQNLHKYAFILENQRRIMHSRREAVLKGRMSTSLLREKASARYESLLPVVGQRVLDEVEKQIALCHINRCWTDYLDYIAYIRESIHLVNMAGKIPLHEFNMLAVDAFEELILKIGSEIVDSFNRAHIDENGIDLEREGLKGPSSTWTYLISDGPDQLGIMPILGSASAAIFSWPLLMALSLFKYITRKKVAD